MMNPAYGDYRCIVVIGIHLSTLYDRLNAVEHFNNIPCCEMRL